jgi:hypothetical protein
MKKVLLLCATIAISVSVMAQFKESYPKGFRKANAPAWTKRGDVLVPKRRDVIDSQRSQAVPPSTQVPTPVAGPLRTQSVLSVSDTTILMGNTKYDLQTNNAVSNRIVWNNDGTISACWTYSLDNNQSASPPYPSRGTGYNYLDPSTGTIGNSLPQGAQGTLAYPGGPAAREESTRTGFTNVVVTPAGKEMIIAHQAVTNATFNRIAVNWRATKGGTKTSNPWTSSAPWGSSGFDTWPKACGGITNENVYVIWDGSGAPATTSSPANIVNGQNGPLVFGRSLDGGLTWEPSKFISEIDSNFYYGFGGDCYSIDAMGDTVAIVVGDTYTDIVLLKSFDAGVTWTKTIVWKHPIPFYGKIDTVTKYMYNDTIVDTIHSHGGDAKVILDMTGTAHVVYSEFDYHDAIATDEFYNPHMGTDNLFYWNESMGPDTTTVWDTLTYGHSPAVAIAAAQDFNGNNQIDVPVDTFTTCTNYYGWGNYQTGITAMPSMGIDEEGKIYIAYQTINELADTQAYHMAHRHMYVVCLPYDAVNHNYNTANLTLPHNIIPSINEGGDGENQECVFGTMARRVNWGTRTGYCLYQADPVPGHSLAADASCEKYYNLQNAISAIYLCKIDLNNLGIGIDEITSNDVQIGQNFPNPANDATNIAINLKKAADVKVEVADVLGNLVYKESKGKLSTGGHMITLNTSNYAKGVYTYTIYTGDFKTTRKMIVQ